MSLRLFIFVILTSKTLGYLDPTAAPWLLFIRHSDPDQYAISTFEKPNCHPLTIGNL